MTISAVVSVSLPNTITVAEGNRTARVCADLIGMAERSVEIILSTENGTALG